ncbi:MAG: hypothetical protein EAZ53_05255 [Bacteroidetes bacterium]|nr:MAG: hypothetical protein EAZ53_05255 [Bacteroidota bacterium]
MSYNNLSVTLPQADVDAVKAAIATINSKLPFLISLTNDERKSLFKMGPKSIDFVQSSLRVVNNNANILPASFSVPEFAKDVNAYVPMSEIMLLIDSLNEKINDTAMAMGSEAMKQSLDVYDYVKTAAKRTPGLKSVADELGQRFKEQGLKSAKTKLANKNKPE